MEGRTDELVLPATELARRGAFRDFSSRLFREKKIAVLWGAIVLAFLIAGVFAHFFAPHSIDAINLADRLTPPSSQYLLGTDHFGRDVLSRIIYGARISMIVGLASSALLVAIATILGLFSGYLGGKFDIILQRFIDSVLCFPPMFMIITIMSLLKPGMLSVILVMGIWWGIGHVRVIRGMVLSTKTNIYIEAARAVGCSTWRMLWRHILPQLVPAMIVLFTTTIGATIIMEATLSYLGYGIPPPQPSWGGMLNLEGRKYMLQAPWLAFWPGFCLAIVIYALNMFGDAVRDILDPRLRGGVGRYSVAKKEKGRLARLIKRRVLR